MQLNLPQGENSKSTSGRWQILLTPTWWEMQLTCVRDMCVCVWVFVRWQKGGGSTAFWGEGRSCWHWLHAVACYRAQRCHTWCHFYLKCHSQWAHHHLLDRVPGATFTLQPYSNLAKRRGQQDLVSGSIRPLFVPLLHNLLCHCRSLNSKIHRKI